MSPRKLKPRQKPKQEIGNHRHGECANVVEETKFRTLNLKGEPTMGRCPYYKEGKFCVLLSDRSCINFKPRNEVK